MKTKYYINDNKEVSLEKFTQNIIENTLWTIFDEVEEAIKLEKCCEMNELPIEEVLEFYTNMISNELTDIAFKELNEVGQWQDYRIERVADKVELTDAQEKALKWWKDDCQFKSIDVFRLENQVMVHWVDSFDTAEVAPLRDVLDNIEGIIKWNFNDDLNNNDVELLSHDIKDLEMIVQAINDLRGEY